ncbi:MAG TPA: YceI family protein [Bacteroidales bacterium]|nr:YceI family protein [Bacteroidales bacterium]
MKKILFFICLLLVIRPVSSQSKAIVELNKSSSISILVESNMMNFTLVQKGEKLLKAPTTVTFNVRNNKLFVDQNKLDIDVKGFKSDNLMAQSEFYKLMMVDKYPKMKIELLRFDSGLQNSNDELYGTAWLNITITNVTKKYEFPVRIDQDNGFMHVAGKRKVNIKDFGLSAPKSLLLGMLKINDQIQIDLNFLLRLRTKQEEVAN